MALTSRALGALLLALVAGAAVANAQILGTTGEPVAIATPTPTPTPEPVAAPAPKPTPTPTPTTTTTPTATTTNTTATEAKAPTPTTTIKAPASTGPSTGNCLSDGLTKAGLTAYVKMMDDTGLSGFFTAWTESNLTLLVPSNEALYTQTSNFSAFPKATLRVILYYHVVKGSYGGGYIKNNTGKALPSLMDDEEAAAQCGGEGKGRGGITIQGSGATTMLEGVSSAAGIAKYDIPLCGGYITVHELTQVLVPCCLESKEILEGVPSLYKPVFVQGNNSVINLFQENILALSQEKKPSLPRAMFVPTGPAWGAFNLPRLFSQAGLEAPGRVQTEFLLQVLALYHTTYDNATVFDLTTSSVDTQAVVFSALGRAGKVTGATCPQRVRLGYRPSGSLNQAPTFIAAADDQRSSGRLTAYYQSCTGTYVYQIDAVLMPCNFVNLVPLVKEGEDVQGFSSGNFTEDTLGDTFSSSPPVVAFNRTRRTNGAAHDTTSCIKNWVAAAAALAAGAGIML